MQINDFVQLNATHWTSRTQSIPLFNFDDSNVTQFDDYAPALTVWFDCKQHFFWRIGEDIEPECLETRQDLVNAFKEIENILEKNRLRAIDDIKRVLNNLDRLTAHYNYFNPIKNLTVYTDKQRELSLAQKKALMLLETTKITHLPKPKLEF